MNDSDLTVEDITPIQAAEYIDSELLSLLGDGESIDYTIGAHNISCIANGNVVGVVSFSLHDGMPRVHPKVKKCHGIYAERVCGAAVEYLKVMGFFGCTAVIPKNRCRAIRMAEKFAMDHLATIEGKNVYRMVFNG